MIIGKREVERGVVVVKNLRAFEQVECRELECVINVLRKTFSTG